MRWGLLRFPGFRFAACLLTGLMMAASARAQQQMPPAEPPLPLPGSSSGTNALRVTTNEVLVPTLVERRGGGILYGLKPDDFVLEDNGVAQKIRVQPEMDTAPVALVVAVELGGASVLEFGKLAKLGPLLDLYLADPGSKVALVGFDSEPHLICDFTRSGDEVNQALKELEPGDGRDAIRDTVSYAVDLLDIQPKPYRRVLLLISEERDHGSKHIKIPELIRKIGMSDVLVLSVSFSPARAELAHDAKDNGDDRTMNLFSTLAMIVPAFQKNVAKEIALMSGGEYEPFSGGRRFEQRVVSAARDTRNRYLITFSPSNPTPGLHNLRVRLAQDYGARIVARANYWMEAPPAVGPDAR